MKFNNLFIVILNISCLYNYYNHKKCDNFKIVFCICFLGMINTILEVLKTSCKELKKIDLVVLGKIDKSHFQPTSYTLKMLEIKLNIKNSFWFFLSFIVKQSVKVLKFSQTISLNQCLMFLIPL